MAELEVSHPSNSAVFMKNNSKSHVYYKIIEGKLKKFKKILDKTYLSVV